MHYAYILQSLSNPDQSYRGHTSDLKRRLNDHNAGKCPHTAQFRPWKVKFYAAFETEDLAHAFERYLKTGSGHAFANRHLLAPSNLPEPVKPINQKLSGSPSPLRVSPRILTTPG
jgi:predicted GIY-YIG superfamily endonuclease